MKKQEFISKSCPFPYIGFKSDDIVISFSNIEDYKRLPFYIQTISFDIQDDGSGAGWSNARTFTTNPSNTRFYRNGLTRISREHFIENMGFRPRDLNSEITKITFTCNIKQSGFRDFGCDDGYVQSKDFRYDTHCHLSELNKVVFRKVNNQLIELSFSEYKVSKPKFKDFVEGLQEIVFPNFVFEN